MSQGVFPLWNEAGYNDRIVYVFLKEPTLRLFKKWREHDTQWEILQHEKRERQV